MRTNRVFRASGSAILLTFFLLPAIAHAANVTVGCPGGSGGAFKSIGAALAAIGQTGPSTLTVTGTCSENVTLRNARSITIAAPTPGGATIVGPLDDDAFDIIESQGIALVNLDISGTFSSTVDSGGGGEGLFMNASVVRITRCNIHDNQVAGVEVRNGSVLILSNTIIQNNTPNDGLDVIANSTAYMAGMTIRNNGDSLNGGVGVFVTKNSGVVFRQTNTIQNNANIGIQAQDLSNVTLAGRGTTIQGHPTNGIRIRTGSHLEVNSPGSVIRGNGAACPLDPACGGIFVNHDSTASLFTGTITGNQGSGISVGQGSNIHVGEATISNNSGDGVHFQWLSSGHFLPGNSITGNGGASVSCDRTSVAFGDLSGFSKVRCEEIEQPTEMQGGDEDKDKGKDKDKEKDLDR